MQLAETLPPRLLVAVGGNVSLRKTKALNAQGQFPLGSIGPKIEAIRFLEGGGERAIIAHVEEAMPALDGETGTQIVAGDA